MSTFNELLQAEVWRRKLEQAGYVVQTTYWERPKPDEHVLHTSRAVGKSTLSSLYLIEALTHDNVVFSVPSMEEAQKLGYDFARAQALDVAGIPKEFLLDTVYDHPGAVMFTRSDFTPMPYQNDVRKLLVGFDQSPSYLSYIGLLGSQP